MKIALKFLGLILIISSCNPTKNIVASSTEVIIKKELIGTWEFEQLTTKEGEIVDTIRHVGGYEISAGPLTTFRADGTYSQQFTPENIDNGKWYFDEKENAIKYIEILLDLGANIIIDVYDYDIDIGSNNYTTLTLTKIFNKLDKNILPLLLRHLTEKVPTLNRKQKYKLILFKDYLIATKTSTSASVGFCAFSP